MKSSELEQLARQVTPQNARSYALAHGWRRVEGVNGGIALFDRGNSGLDQLIVPLQRSGPDYPRRIVDVLASLSEVENRPAEEILSDLLMPEADILRYRVSSPDTNRGDLSLQHAISVLDGAKRSLLAAACSVVAPEERHHARMSRVEANQLLDSCRLQQTERGSFTVAIACPLRGVETGDPFFDSCDPFTRRATTLLMKSLARLTDAIEQDNPAALYGGHSQTPPVSANLCDALLRMQPTPQDSSLSIHATWASTHPQREATTSTVEFQHDVFPIIEDVYKKLQPSREPRQSLYVGYVDTLNGDIGESGRVEGEVTLLIVHDEEMLKARAELTADDYDQAIDAHREGGLVKFMGVLHLARRVHKITEVREFGRVPESIGNP